MNTLENEDKIAQTTPIAMDIVTPALERYMQYELEKEKIKTAKNLESNIKEFEEQRKIEEIRAKSSDNQVNADLQIGIKSIEASSKFHDKLLDLESKKQRKYFIAFVVCVCAVLLVTLTAILSNNTKLLPSGDDIIKFSTYCVSVIAAYLTGQYKEKSKIKKRKKTKSE